MFSQSIYVVLIYLMFGISCSQSVGKRQNVQPNTDMSDLKLYTDCINFAAIKHREQRRLDHEQTPYINHPIGVAQILTAEGNVTDMNVLMAAVLHDTVEDTDTTFEELEQHFGRKIRDIVEECSDDKNKSTLERKELQIVNAKSASYEAKLVKLADKLYNLRDMERSLPRGWTEQRRQAYYEWAKKVVDNLRGTNKPIENALDVIFHRHLGS